MSEINSSENNSSLSENNSFDDMSNPPESNSLSSPGSNRLSNYEPGYELQSLPILTSSTSNMMRSPNSFEPRRPIGAETDLNSLLTRRQPKFVPQAPKCAKCDKNVYMAEEVRAANKTFHKLCFKCTLCNKLLEPNSLTDHQGDLYCKNCYGKKFGPKGYGYGAGAGILSSDTGIPAVNSTPTTTSYSTLKSTFSSLGPSAQSSANSESPSSSSAPTNGYLRTVTNETPISANSNITKTSANTVTSAYNHEKRITGATTAPTNSNFNFGGSEKCTRCSKSVYAAEKTVAAGKPYHKLCFTCFTCKKSLSSMNCCDNSDGDVFCKCKCFLFFIFVCLDVALVNV